MVPLARAYGAALVVGCIDEDKQQAQAITRARKLQIAQRSHDLLTTKYGVAAEDIIFDALVFPVGTGDQNYIGSGVETIEGIRLIKQALPACKTILGVSNVSFGLPARAALSASFLAMAIEAGLTSAIMNPLSAETMTTVRAADLLVGNDEYGMAWIAALRAREAASA